MFELKNEGPLRFIGSEGGTTALVRHQLRAYSLSNPLRRA